jgi:hypothetical protein
MARRVLCTLTMRNTTSFDSIAILELRNVTGGCGKKCCPPCQPPPQPERRPSGYAVDVSVQTGGTAPQPV